MTPFRGLEGSNGFVAVIGITNNEVVAGSDLSNLQSIETFPGNTAYPSGWAYITANVYDASTSSNKNEGWVMQLFLDRTDQIAAILSVPDAASYLGAMIETTSGTAYFTNIVVSTYEIGINIPGYNNMDGYGQGSGLLVNLLPAFGNLAAQMTLNSWNTPQVGILSFQINAMLYNMRITTLLGQTQTLGSSYMLPFTLDAPSSWSLTYYQNTVSGYQQLS